MAIPIKYADLEKQIKDGVIKGYNEHLNLCDRYSFFTNSIREYLLTVNIAQKLLEWREERYFQDYKIYIEYPIKTFYQNAFPPYKYEGNDIFSMTIKSRRSDLSNTQKQCQKIDIAIARHDMANYPDYDQSVVGIELKGINQPKGRIINDIDRLAQAMVNTDNIASNSIERSYVVFLVRHDSDNIITTKVDIENMPLLEKRKWTEKLIELQTFYPELSFYVESFGIATKYIQPRDETRY